MSRLTLRGQWFQGKEGSFQGKGGRKLPREVRKKVSKERKEGSFLGKRERKLPMEGRKEASMGKEEGSFHGKTWVNFFFLRLPGKMLHFFCFFLKASLIKLHRYIELISVLTKRYLNRKEDEITNKITNESMNHLKEDLKKKLLDKSQCHI